MKTAKENMSLTDDECDQLLRWDRSVYLDWRAVEEVSGRTLGSKGYGVAVTDAPKETLAEKAKRLLDKSFLTDTELARARSELSGLHNQVTNAQNRCTALAVDSKMLALAAGDAYDQYRASLALSPTQAEVSA